MGAEVSAMHLTMMEIQSSKLISSTFNPPFRWTTHHVVQILLEILPTKVTLDGSNKIQLTFGPAGNSPKYWQALGATSVVVEDFDFARYYASHPAEREQTILAKIEESFLDVVSRAGNSEDTKAAIHKAADAVRATGFRLKSEIKRLTRSFRPNGFKIVVFRNLNRDIGEVWSIEIVDRQSQVVHSEWMGDAPNFLVMNDIYKTSNWAGNLFQVKDRFGQVVYQFDVDFVTGIK